jgi:acetoin utilization deacetylase AcuC-like enzyme
MSDTITSWKMEKSQRFRKNLLMSLGVLVPLSIAGYTFLNTGIPDAGIDPASKQIQENGSVIWHPDYAMPWFNRGQQILLSGMAAGHAVNIKRFPSLTNLLMTEGDISLTDIRIPEPATMEDLLQVHTAEYISEVFSLAEEGGLLNGENKINQGLLNFYLASVGGTYETGIAALENGTAINLAGGYHHAFPHKEEGFCFFNDVAIAANKLVSEGLVNKILIIDLDVHHGNGTASIFENNPNIKTFDFFQSGVYPVKGRKPYETDFSYSFHEGIEGYTYLRYLDDSLEEAFEEFNPDIVFYLAGADPFYDDLLGGAELSKDALRERDLLVVNAARQKDKPIAVVLAGGYSHLADLIEINQNTVSVVLNN